MSKTEKKNEQKIVIIFTHYEKQDMLFSLRSARIGVRWEDGGVRTVDGEILTGNMEYEITITE